MLGVVRVYSRKSTYILQDVKNVAQSLKRHSNHQSTRARGAKRGREISNRSAGDKISLDAGDDIANFDQITLPATKRQRERRTSGNDLPGSRSGRGHLTDSAENRSRSTFQIGDLSFGESGDIDVVQAMETLFPSVIVPPLRDHLESGLNSPSSGFRSENLATPLYKARDEDITLTAPSANLQDLGYEMFDEDLSVSLRSDPSSRAGDGRGGMEDGLEDAADMAAAFGAHRLDLSAAGTQEQTVPVHNPPDELFTIADPIEMEPPRTGPPHHAPAQADRPRGQPESEDDGLSTKGGGRKSVRSKAVEAENGNTTPFRTPSPNKTIPVSVAKFSTARKRRTPRFRVDEVTELSPTEVRACLHDTTDIVLPKEHRRVNRKQVRKTESREEDFPMPDFLAGFSTDITALWNEVSSQTTIDTDSREASPPRPLQSNGNRGTRAERRNSGSSSKNQENTAAARRGAPPPQDAFFPEQPEDFLDGPLAVPINERLEALNHVHSFRAPGPGPFSTQKGSTGSGSNEVLRAADEPGLLPVDNLSFPSNSAGHHTHSVSEPSGKTASRASGERLRDRLFEKVSFFITVYFSTAIGNLLPEPGADYVVNYRMVIR